MVKKVSNILSIILIVIITVLTIYKLNKRHVDKLYNVLYSEIKYEAKKCYLEEKCEKNITLRELYEKDYLEIKYDPISKEELNSDLKITIENNNVKVEGYND